MYAHLRVLASELPSPSVRATPSPEVSATAPPATPSAEVSGFGVETPNASTPTQACGLTPPPPSSSWCAPFLERLEDSFNSLLRARVPAQKAAADTARTERVLRRTGGAAQHNSSTPVCWVAPGVLGRPMLGISRVTIGGDTYYVDAQPHSAVDFTAMHLRSIEHARRAQAATQDIVANVSARSGPEGYGGARGCRASCYRPCLNASSVRDPTPATHPRTPSSTSAVYPLPSALAFAVPVLPIGPRCTQRPQAPGRWLRAGVHVRSLSQYVGAPAWLEGAVVCVCSWRRGFLRQCARTPTTATR